MAGEWLGALALIGALVAFFVIFPRLMFRALMQRPLIDSGRPRVGPGVLFSVVRWVVEAAVSAVATVAGLVAMSLGRAASHGAGQAWRWSVNAAASRGQRRKNDPDGLEDLWRRSP